MGEFNEIKWSKKRRRLSSWRLRLKVKICYSSGQMRNVRPDNKNCLIRQRRTRTILICQAISELRRPATTAALNFEMLTRHPYCEVQLLKSLASPVAKS